MFCLYNGIFSIKSLSIDACGDMDHLTCHLVAKGPIYSHEFSIWLPKIGGYIYITLHSIILVLQNTCHTVILIKLYPNTLHNQLI